MVPIQRDKAKRWSYCTYAVMWWMWWNDCKCRDCKLVVKYGADINKRAIDSISALYLAVESGKCGNYKDYY